MRRIPALNIALFVVTFLTTLVVGTFHAMNIPLNNTSDLVNFLQGLLRDPLALSKGLPFSITLMVILLAHESAHYIASRKHRVVATLPFFIPAPSVFGTLGAFIKMKSPIPSKNALMDIGTSGPIAGFIMSVIACLVGLSMSKVMPAVKVTDEIAYGQSLLFYWMAKLFFGNIPTGYGIVMSPIAFASWIGFFVTSLNLIPVGQLDGGHIAYALLGERHAKISKVLIGVLLVMGVTMYIGWLLWAGLLMVLGFRHPPIVGWATLIIFIVTFIPVPFFVLGT